VIKEYDQAVLDLTASLVAGTVHLKRSDVDLYLETKFVQKRREEEEFMEWLSPATYGHTGWSRVSFMFSENKGRPIPYNGFLAWRSSVLGVPAIQD
jgi:hypothetical protein